MTWRGPRAWVLAGALALGAMPLAAQPVPVVAPAATSQDPNEPVEFQSYAEARHKTDEILHRHEFRHVEQSTWLDRARASVMNRINRLFVQAGELIPQSPWFATALEWGALAIAAAALMLWVWRTNRQQRIVIAEAHGGEQIWRKESDNWAERAKESAARGDWREAVHCLYWSAIVLLEGQHLWRQNRARTPREYVALLPPDSAKRTALGGLTRVFERIWYGLRPAAEADYRHASAMLDDLRSR